MTTFDPRREPLGKLLVPTDFSKRAERALGRALLLPLAQSAKLHILHVVPDLPADARAKATLDAKQALEKLVVGARSETVGRNVEVTSEVLSGEPFVEIIRRARSWGAELIVLGRHGRRPIRDMFIGTTAERVIRQGDVPVLVVNSKPARLYRRPLVATDLEDSSRRTFELALRVLGPAINHIHIVHAFNVPFEGFVTPSLSAREKSDYRKSFKENAVAGLAAFLESYRDVGVRCKSAIRPGDARSTILLEADRCRADLIALGTHGRSGAVHALVGSVAEWIITASTCDVLVARPIRFSFELP